MSKNELLLKNMNDLLQLGYEVVGRMVIRSKDRPPLTCGEEINSFRKGFMEELGRQSAKQLIAELESRI